MITTVPLLTTFVGLALLKPILDVRVKQFIEHSAAAPLPKKSDQKCSVGLKINVETEMELKKIETGRRVSIIALLY